MTTIEEGRKLLGSKRDDCMKRADVMCTRGLLRREPKGTYHYPRENVRIL